MPEVSQGPIHNFGQSTVSTVQMQTTQAGVGGDDILSFPKPWYPYLSKGVNNSKPPQGVAMKIKLVYAYQPPSAYAWHLINTQWLTGGVSVGLSVLSISVKWVYQRFSWKLEGDSVWCLWLGKWMLKRPTGESRKIKFMGPGVERGGEGTGKFLLCKYCFEGSTIIHAYWKAKT